jgi:hypothetical protein
MFVVLMEEIYEIRRRGGFIWHDSIPSFMNIGTGFQAIQWFYLRNLMGCNVGITGGRDLRSTLLRLAQVP